MRAAFSRFGEYRKPAQRFDPATMGFAPQALSLMGGLQVPSVHHLRRLQHHERELAHRVARFAARRLGLRLRPPVRQHLVLADAQLAARPHSLRSGYELRYRRWNITSAPYGAGRYFFDGNFTRANNAAAQDVLAQEFAQFLLGLPTSARTTASRPPAATRASSRSRPPAITARPRTRCSSRTTGASAASSRSTSACVSRSTVR
jgi:hypothetical protein